MCRVYNGESNPPPYHYNKHSQASCFSHPLVSQYQASADPERRISHLN